MLKPTVVDNYTTIELDILSTYFYLDHVSENIIKGNSLPLNIYRDNEYEESEYPASKMWHSFVEPSVADSYTLTADEFDAYKFKYYCFGSDAQAIHIMAYDSKQNFNKKYKTITYHGNGGNLSGYVDMKDVTYRILEGDPDKSIKWDIFEMQGGIFLGWSTDKTAINADLENYPQETTFNYDSINSSALHLYAIWITYQFGADDTMI